MKRASSFGFVGRAAAMALVLVTPSSPALGSNVAEPFEAPRDRGSFDRALQCLTEAVYYEARSESDDGQRAVAQVVLNRVRHPAYPNSVCGVVYQGSHRRTGCQFTFTCDGSITGTVNESAWSRAQRIAGAALRGYVYRPVGLALNYHTTAIRPYWAPSLDRQAVIGAHVFYRRPDSTHVAAFDQAPASIEPRANSIPAFVETRATRSRGTRAARSQQSLQVERAILERPIMERPVVERPVNFPIARPRRAAGEVRREPQPRARPVPVPVQRGSRTTIENGVRVTRGS